MPWEDKTDIRWEAIDKLDVRRGETTLACVENFVFCHVIVADGFFGIAGQSHSEQRAKKQQVNTALDHLG